MTITLSERVSRIKPSPTVAINTRANELRAKGHNIINLSVGEPDFNTPEFIKDAAKLALDENFTKYTAVDGIAVLKEAIITKLARDNQLNYQADEIIVSNGVKHSLYNLAQALLNSGDEVIIPAPYWVSYPAIVLLADAKPVYIETSIEQHFKMSPEQLEAAITPKTRMVFLNSPSNPSGQVYTRDELAALAEVLKQHPQIIIASDDIYEYLLWSTDHYDSILQVAPELREQTIVFNGVAKAHAMTGWRIGYAAGPKPIIQAMKKIQSQSTTNPNSIAQRAAAVAIASPRSAFQDMVDTFKRRHDFVYQALSAIESVNAIPSDGTFYLFPNVEQVLARLGLESDLALAELLLDKAEIAIVPGTAFGSPGHIRFSYANSDDNLKTAVTRMTKLFN